eukprot:4885801-Pyramimonas_sp.AAC.1
MQVRGCMMLNVELRVPGRTHACSIGCFTARGSGLPGGSGGGRRLSRALLGGSTNADKPTPIPKGGPSEAWLWVWVLFVGPQVRFPLER